jgi:hypothetical protein
MSATKAPQADVHVSGGGTMYLVTPLSDEAKAWVEENVPLEDWQWLGSGFGVEHRYIGNLVEGMREAGLVVQ